MITYETFTDARLGEIAEFWNDGPAKLHNGWRVSAAALTSRVFQKRTGAEAFDAAGYIVAIDGAAVVGAVHASIQSERVAQVLAADWPGGTRGAILFLYVRPSYRRRGVGTELWRRATAYLGGCRSTFIDGHCLNPFYGNSEGPVTPLFGTPEGISLPWDDEATKAFLAQKGFTPKYKAVQYARALATVPAADPDVRVLPSCFPSLGQAIDSPPRVDPMLIFETAIALDGPTVAGTLCFYPMLDARQGLFGIYELAVAETHRGRGLGRKLLASALARMRECSGESVEVLTIPDLSPDAVKLYESMDFKPVASWAIY